MKATQMFWLAPVVLAMFAGCLDTASNPDNILPPVDEDKDPSGGDDGDGCSCDDDGDAPDGGMGDGDGPVESMIDGTAESAMCTSFTAVSDNTCYGYYCGVSEEMIAAELSPTRKCQLPADILCAGTLSQKVAACARQVISNPLNIGNSDEQLRGKIQDCVYEDQPLKDVTSEECLSCYLDGAMCAREHCTGPCLGGDSANCDACREENNCNQSVPGCAGLPTPF